MKRLRVYRKPLSVASSIVSVSANRQYFDADLQEYIPDFRLIPFVFSLKASLTADGTVSEVTTFIDTVVEEEISGDWTRKNSTTTFVIDVSAGNVKMYENTSRGTNRKFRMTAKVADPRDPVKYVTITEQFTLFSEILALSPFVIKESYADGQTAHVLKSLDAYRLHAPLYRGQEEWFYTYYRWFIDKAGNWKELTENNSEGISGLNTPLLSVPFYTIPLEGLKVKVIADPVLDTSGINLISKKMISEDWNNIYAGISTKEEDEDGKYFNINHVNLYEYVTKGSNKNDVFLGRVKYKPDQQYVLSVKWKLDSELTNSGLIFVVVYTDNITSRLDLLKNQTTLKYDRLITLKNKTIQKIYSTYGAGDFTKIYDLQLIEYANITNLCPDSWALKSGSSADIPLKNILEIGKTYRYAVDYKCKIKSSINILDNKTPDHYGVIELSPSSEFVRVYSDPFTIKEGFDSTTAVLYLYGGTTGNNNVQFKNVFLCEGEEIPQIWYPSDGEFIPAISDGALKPDISKRAMATTMALTKIYPNPVNKEISVSANGNLPSLGSVFAGECSLTGNIGLIQNPQNYYSCIWRKRPVSTGLWSEFAKGFGIIDTMNEEMDIDVLVEKGLANAKYMACFDGIDDHLEMHTSGFFENTTPLFNKIYKVDFIVFSFPENIAYMVDFRYGTECRFAITINRNKNLTIFTTLNKKYIIDQIETNERYYIIIETNNLGELVNVQLNGKPVTPMETDYQFSPALYNLLLLGGGNTVEFHGSILSFALLDKTSDSKQILYYDFQPNNGNRANMLKNKRVDGSVNIEYPYDLSAVNVGNLNDINPETGFFRPTPAQTGLLNK